MVSIRTLTVVGTMFCSTALASCARSEPETNGPPPKTHTVIMEGMVFQPDVITVTSGDTIVWVNKDMVPHSATSPTAGFDSKVIPANASWRHRVEQPGDFYYVCSFHPTMTAKLQVRDESTSVTESPRPFVWLDAISRDLIVGGGLARFIHEDGLRGVSSNRTIFEVIATSREYDATTVRATSHDVRMSDRELATPIVVEDIQMAGDLCRGVYDNSDGAKGFVSIEISPCSAHEPRGHCRRNAASVATCRATERDDQGSSVETGDQCHHHIDVLARALRRSGQRLPAGHCEKSGAGDRQFRGLDFRQVVSMRHSIC